MIRTYASPEAFKQALESHIRAAAQKRGFGIGRMRQLFIVERLLVRLHAGFADRIVTKGGLALEMRLTRARTTKDLDLRLSGDAASLQSDLNAAAASDQFDWLVFSVRPDAVHPTIEGDGIVYEGHRFVVNATLARWPYGDPFGLDVGFGDALTEATFQARGTHPLPDHLPAPPVSWVSRYATITQSDDLEWKSLDAVYAAAQAFMDPVLAGGAGVWTPEKWGWGPR